MTRGVVNCWLLGKRWCALAGLGVQGAAGRRRGRYGWCAGRRECQMFLGWWVYELVRWRAGGWRVRVVQAYRFALDPSAVQERALRSHAGAARFGWNWGLGKCQERYAAEGTWYSAVDLHRLWNAVKKADPALAWWAENSKCSYQEAFRDLDRALRAFTESRTGERKGRRVGFPGSRSGAGARTRSGFPPG